MWIVRMYAERISWRENTSIVIVVLLLRLGQNSHLTSMLVLKFNPAMYIVIQ